MTALLVQALLTERSQSGLSPRSVQYIRAVLRRAFGQAMKWGLVARNIVSLTEPPRIPFREVRPLDVEQAKVFLRALEGNQFETLFTVALARGLREGEALVFSTRRGRPLEGCRVNRDFKRVLRSANLPKQRFHDLRHACATFLIAQSVPMRVVMEVLGVKIGVSEGSSTTPSSKPVDFPSVLPER